MGIISPIGAGTEQFWANALAGISGIRAIEQFPLDGFKAKIAGQVAHFHPRDFGLREKQIHSLDRYAQFALAASWLAVEDARLLRGALERERAGVCISNAICGTRYMEEKFLQLTQRGTTAIDPLWVDRALYQAFTFNAASAEVANQYRFAGPCLTVSTGCTGGLDAIGMALELIRVDDADVMICGAAEAPITPVALAAFDVIGALSSRYNDTPARASRPFDAGRDGFVLGEGAGILILEEREHARRRGAPIYAEVRGFASGNNAFHMTDLPPDGAELARVLRLALADAAIAPEAIDYISAHGSSTRQNDVNETAAYKTVLGEHARRVPISSLKSMCGHPLAAANALETVAAILTLQSGRIAPTINQQQADPLCDLDYVPNRAIEKRVNVVLKDASGFSGIHSAALFSRHEDGGRL
jgi:3-oxoacyl-(acyl-carrier-protein) synthase